jgi:RNA polymerase sigma factor (sigma-70 family)
MGADRSVNTTADGGGGQPESMAGEHKPAVEVLPSGLLEHDRNLLAADIVRVSWDELCDIACRSSGCDRDQAEDIASEVLVMFLHGHLGRGFYGAATVDRVTWYLKGAIRKVARSRLRTTRRRERLLHCRGGRAPLETSSEDVLHMPETSSVVAQALNRLTPAQREVATLHWQAEMSVPEIAHRTGRAVNTVKELLRRARRTLRPLLVGLNAVER